MNSPKIFNRKKVNEGEAHYNEGNLIKMKKSEGLKSKVIDVNTGMRIINIIGSIVGVIVVGIVIFGVYLLLSHILDFDSVLTTEQPAPEASYQTKNSIAQEAHAVWPPNPALR